MSRLYLISVSKPLDLASLNQKFAVTPFPYESWKMSFMTRCCTMMIHLLITVGRRSLRVNQAFTLKTSRQNWRARWPQTCMRDIDQPYTATFGFRNNRSFLPQPQRIWMFHVQLSLPGHRAGLNSVAHATSQSLLLGLLC